MATFHSGSEGQTQKLQALRRRQKYLAFRAVIVPPVCWGICAASAPWWFPPLKEMLGVRFDAQTHFLLHPRGNACNPIRAGL